MLVRVSNKLIIENAPQEVLAWCRLNLILDNPDYYKKERMGKWTGNTPKQIVLYEQIGTDIYLPFGCVRDFHTMFGNITAYNSEIHDFKRVLYNSNINLYDYQENAVKRILGLKNGVVVMPCGAGKTQTALEAVARIGGRTLWLTHTQDLLNQSYNRAKSVLDTSASYGKITAGKVNIGQGITFATVQTMSKLNLTAYKDVWDVIIVDECQHCCGSPTRVTQFYKVLSNLSARYKIGLTATPKRADGLEQAMFALLGGIIHEVKREEVAHTTCPVRIVSRETNYTPEYDAVLMGDGTLNYAKLVDDLIHDEDRFNVVLNELHSLGKSVLVLANRVDYIERLNKAFNGKSVCLSTLGNSKKAKAQRKEALRKLNDGELDCIFASYKLASEGLDCPNLRYIVLATPEKDSTIIEQSTGRVARKADGKECGTVIDFMDDFGMYKSWYKKRLAIYNRLKYDII